MIHYCDDALGLERERSDFDAPFRARKCCRSQLKQMVQKPWRGYFVLYSYSNIFVLRSAEDLSCMSALISKVALYWDTKVDPLHNEEHSVECGFTDRRQQ